MATMERLVYGEFFLLILVAALPRRVSVVSVCRTFIHHRNTEDTKIAQRRPQTKTLPKREKYCLNERVGASDCSPRKAVAHSSLRMSRPFENRA
jgi:hypothetical protein